MAGLRSNKPIRHLIYILVTNCHITPSAVKLSRATMEFSLVDRILLKRFLEQIRNNEYDVFLILYDVI